MAFPEEFIKRIQSQFGSETYLFLKALEEPAPVSIRVNRAKWDGFPVNSEPVPWCSQGYYLEKRPSFTLDPLFHSGCYYPQEASSMFLEQAVGQSYIMPNNIRVLDLCGAPGGKSIHLSDIIGPESLLVSNEVIKSRSAVLSETITKWGSGNVIVTNSDPMAFGRLEGYFDIIVVDAPCSGEGMFRNRTAVKEWSEMNTALCAERQKRILMDIWPALKQDGLLVYSTCTFNPGENEENIRWLLGKKEGDCVRLDISGFRGVKEIDFEGIYGYGFYPDRIKGEGFFISAIRKKGRQEKIQVKSQKNNSSSPDKRDIRTAEKWSFSNRDRLLKWGDEVFAIPCDMNDYMLLFRNLRLVRPGTKLFRLKKDDYLPSHDLALSAMLRNEAFPRAELSYPEAISYLRKENFPNHEFQRGWNLVTYRGVNLGFINNIGSRFNNYYPLEWRIKMTPKGNEEIFEWSGKNPPGSD